MLLAHIGKMLVGRWVGDELVTMGDEQFHDYDLSERNCDTTFRMEID